MSTIIQNVGRGLGSWRAILAFWPNIEIEGNKVYSLSLPKVHGKPQRYLHFDYHPIPGTNGIPVGHTNAETGGFKTINHWQWPYAVKPLFKAVVYVNMAVIYMTLLVCQVERMVFWTKYTRA
jgi:hypothetical protein